VTSGCLINVVHVVHVVRVIYDDRYGDMVREFVHAACQLRFIALTILHSVNDFNVRHQPRNNNNNNAAGFAAARRCLRFLVLVSFTLLWCLEVTLHSAPVRVDVVGVHASHQCRRELTGPPLDETAS